MSRAPRLIALEFITMTGCQQAQVLGAIARAPSCCSKLSNALTGLDNVDDVADMLSDWLDEYRLVKGFV